MRLRVSPDIAPNLVFLTMGSARSSMENSLSRNLMTATFSAYNRHRDSTNSRSCELLINTDTRLYFANQSQPVML